MTRVIHSQPFNDFVQDLFEQPDMAINVIVLMSDEPRHIRRGRRSPIVQPTTQPTVRDGKGRSGRVTGGKRDWRKR